MSYSAWAAVTKYRLDGLNNNHLFLTVLEARRPRISDWGEPSSWFAEGYLFCSILTCRRPWALISSNSYKGANPIMKAPPSWPHLNLITSKRPLHLTPSLCGLGLHHMHFSGIQSFSPQNREKRLPSPFIQNIFWKTVSSYPVKFVGLLSF